MKWDPNAHPSPSATHAPNHTHLELVGEFSSVTEQPSILTIPHELLNAIVVCAAHRNAAPEHVDGFHWKIQAGGGRVKADAEIRG